MVKSLSHLLNSGAVQGTAGVTVWVSAVRVEKPATSYSSSDRRGFISARIFVAVPGSSERARRGQRSSFWVWTTPKCLLLIPNAYRMVDYI